MLLPKLKGIHLAKVNEQGTYIKHFSMANFISFVWKADNTQNNEEVKTDALSFLSQLLQIRIVLQNTNKGSTRDKWVLVT